MWVAIAIVMTMQGPVALTDQRGPYATLEECEARIAEAKAILPRAVPGVMAVAGRCEKEESI